MLIGMERVFSIFMVISYCCLQLCGAQTFTCTVTRADDCTVYNISVASHDSDIQATECRYSWTNGTNHVLANQIEETPGLVKINSIDTLVTLECFDKITLTRSCTVMSELREHTAYCTANCSVMMKINEDKVKQEMSYSWIAPVVAAAVILVLGVLFVIFRKKMRRSCSREDAL